MVWGQSFKNIVRKDERGFGAYQIDVEALDEKVVSKQSGTGTRMSQELLDPLNQMFAPIAEGARKVTPAREKIGTDLPAIHQMR